MWYPTGDGEYGSVPLYIAEDIEESCGLRHAGCIVDEGVIVGGLDWRTTRGCTVVTHEWLHLYGISEQDMPDCLVNQWRMVHGSQ